MRSQRCIGTRHSCWFINRRFVFYFRLRFGLWNISWSSLDRRLRCWLRSWDVSRSPFDLNILHRSVSWSLPDFQFLRSCVSKGVRDFTYPSTIISINLEFISTSSLEKTSHVVSLSMRFVQLSQPEVIRIAFIPQHHIVMPLRCLSPG